MREKTWEERWHEFIDTCNQFAKAKADDEKLEHMKKNILALAAAASSASTVAERMNDAYKSEMYLDWIDKKWHSTVRRESLFGKKDAAHLWFRRVQDEEANKREEMRLGRG